MLRRWLLSLLMVPCLGFDWPGEVYRIQRELDHSEPAQRRELVRKLAQFSAESVKQPLLLALEDQDAKVRHEAAAVVGRVRLREAVPILLDWLDDKDPETRRAAAAALGRVGEARAVAPLVRALGDVQGEVRRAAVSSLAKLASPEALVPLTGRLDDPDLGVRIEAIAALEGLRDARSVVPLLGACADASAEVRSAAVTALGAISDVRALPALARALGDDVDEVQLAAAAALGRLGDAGGVRALQASLERAEARLGQAIVAALGNIDDAAARELLVAQLAVPALRRSATLALVEQARKLARPKKVAAPQPALEVGTPAATVTTPQPEPLPALVAALGAALAASRELPTKLALGDALARIAQVASLAPALDALLAELPAAEGELAATLMLALGASGEQGALVPLLEQLGQTKGEALSSALDALRLYFDRGANDSRAADPLLERLASASPEQRVQIATLLGRVGAARALPALVPLFTHEHTALRLAAVRAAGALGVPDALDRQGAAPALLPLLDAADPATRFEAARALRTTADEAALQHVLVKLQGAGAADRHALLVALGGGLAQLAAQRALTPEFAHAALLAMDAIARDEDDELADRAIDAIGVWAPAGALEVLAPKLRSPSSRRRASATLAIGLLVTQESRKILRYLLRGGSERDAAAAALALAEIGDERDLAALMKASKRMHWPVPGAAAFSLARMAQRGALRPHAAARALCELGASREPYIRANVAAALASLGARACENGGPDPLRWLTPEHAPIVRAAAARWAHAAAAAGKLDAATVEAALARCVALDVETSVREVCAAPQLPEAREPADVYAYAPDGTTLLRDRLIALRLADGTVYLGYTDRNGHVRLRSAPRGALRLEEAELAPLETE